MDKEQLQYKILSKTVKTSSCWFYTGTKSSGYGIIYLNGTEKVAHRLMYEAVIGEIPEGTELDHLCGIKHCVNPEHLQVVTHLENTRRGPQSKGRETLEHLMPSKKKTFLLYIHAPQFKSEPKKSDLVNKLLNIHYAGALEPFDDLKEYTVNKTMTAPSPAITKAVNRIAKAKMERSDHCHHGYNLRVMKCKRGCKK